MRWENTTEVSGQKYTCGYCDHVVGPSKAYLKMGPNALVAEKILICPNCEKPTYLGHSPYGQTPGAKFGEEVDHLPPEIKALYNEARACVAVNAYTASVLACIKLLMNIAVAQGAEEGKKFVEYVKYLADRGFVPPNGQGWVDQIRSKGNEATHEIALMKRGRCEGPDCLFRDAVAIHFRIP